jgi:uncharacterized protein
MLLTIHKMERKIESKLDKWKKSRNRKPLILRGARQVGKTWSLLAFGKKYYRTVAYFNFESNAELQAIFERDLNPDRIISELSAHSGQAILKADTLIIFDEIQASERALTSLKYFNEDAPEFHIAAAGSLLGVAVNRKKYSFPVGKVDFLNMFPLDFEEFLINTGRQQAATMIRESFAQNQLFSLHQSFLSIYNDYLYAGGMPQVIKEMIATNDHNLMTAIKKSISDAYIADMAKYASPEETVRIMAVYNSIPAQLAKENRKFQYNKIKSGARSAHYEIALDWLDAAGIINKCIKIDSGVFPLIVNEDRSSFKIYLNDTGLLCSKFGIPAAAFIGGVQGYENIKGALSENYVANVLTANGFETRYWESQGKAEVDFVLQKKSGEIIPVEVKSSHHVNSKSLRQFVAKYNPSWSIRISQKNFGFENNIKSVPLYAAFCIEP